MGIFGFFKGRKAVEAEVEVEDVAFGKIKSWTGDKEVLLLKDEALVLGEISEKVDGFCVSVDMKLGVLERIDVESKKEHERAKILVRQGLNNYIKSVRGLLKDLSEVERNHLEGFAKDIVKVFNYFEKTSALFYGRANYLIGDEMAAVRNEIRQFYNGLVELINGTVINDLKRVGAVKMKLDEFEKVGRSFRDVEDEISGIDSGIDKAKDRVKKLENEIDEIKSSSEYTSGVAARDEISGLRAGLDSEILKLKGLIDFKRLANVVHSNDREMKIVKEYQAHFASEFGRDRGERLLGLLSGCNMKSAEVGVQVDLIERKRWELIEKHEGIGTDYTVKKFEEVKNIQEEIDSMELVNIKSDRRLGELRLRLKGLKNEVIGLVEELGVKII